MNKFSLLLFLMVLTMMSCRDEIIEDDPSTTPIGVDTNFEQDILGQVLTVAGDPIADATIVTKDEMVMSNDQGLFLLSETSAGNRGTQISATKDGFLYGGYRLYVNEAGKSHVDIVLMEAKNLGTFQASIGGEIQVAQNSFADFPANAFTLNGTDPYDGNVNITGNWIDPTDDELLRLSPGDLGGINLENGNVLLSSYGMIGIELSTDAGEELQIRDGMEATLKFEVPNSMLSDAPATIPLWSFDEIEGVWIEESSADLVGNQYVGQVSHFSWWNTDIPNAVLDICIQVVDEATGIPIANAYIYVNNLTGFGCASGYTDYRGVLCGLIPADSELMITVTSGDNGCASDLFSVTIGPFPIGSPPIQITVPVDFADQFLSDISGVVTDCITGDPVENAIVNVYGNIIQTEQDGTYSQTLNLCTELPSLEIEAFHLTTLKEGTETLTDVNGGSYTADIALCDDVDELFNFDNVISTNCEIRVRPFETHILVSDPTYVLMAFEGDTEGTFDIVFYNGNSSNIGSISVEIDDFGDVGEKVSGIFWSADPAPIQLGTFTGTRVE